MTRSTENIPQASRSEPEQAATNGMPDSMAMKTCVVLVNWKGAVDTIECLEALSRLHGDFSVVVVDNNSNDGSLERIIAWASEAPARSWSSLQYKLPENRKHSVEIQIIDEKDINNDARCDEAFITLIKSSENRGFAGGNNLGIQFALRDEECDFVWILNNDTVPEASALEELLERMLDPSISICGSTLLFHDAPEQVQTLGGRYDVWRALGGAIGFGRNVHDLPSISEVESQMAYVAGASMLVRRAIFERTGGISEDYFLYFEEIDLARNLNFGERQAWAPKSIVYHKEGGAIGTSSRERSSKTSVYYLRVNMLRFYRKYHRALLPVAIARIVRQWISHVVRLDGRGAAATMLAVSDFARGRHRRGPL